MEQKKLSVVVIDVSEAWEEMLKAHEYGYLLDWDYLDRKWCNVSQKIPLSPLEIDYPYGTARAGFNAITDTIRIAHSLGHTIYATSFYTGWTDGEEQPCYSLRSYIPKENIFDKGDYSAFSSKEFTARMEAEKQHEVMIIGYDRDCCVLETIKDAVSRGMKVVTSEQVMLTKNNRGTREESLRYFKENTIFLEELVDVWNYFYPSQK
ncbi:MAG: isochorismatase family protein [Nanoarchaeota archaeon]|nr:isochorismatase family protein [Nanoarchaeota archaeon]